MGNTRGNTYSRNHTTLDTCSSCHEFWSFGFDDSGNKDYPAEINYILDKTGEEKVHFIGHSMGTTQILVIWSINHYSFISRLKRLSLIEATLDTTFIFCEVFLTFF